MMKPSYEELEDMIRSLQARVEKEITIEQDLINVKNELDAELNRFQLMQKYSSDALKTADVSAFYELTVEYFVEIFNLPRIIFLEQDETGNRKLLAQFGLSHEVAELALAFDKSFISGNKSQIIREGAKGFESIQKLHLKEAIIAPICDQNQQCTGMILAGLQEDEFVYYGAIQDKIADSFALMTQKVGDHMGILRVNTRLKEGIEKATRELELQAAELKRSNHDLEQFAFATSHDLKAPLRNIASFVQLLNRKYKDQFDEEGREYMQFVLNGVHRLNNLIKDLLQFSRIGRFDANIEFIDMHDIFQMVSHNLKDQIDAQQAIIRFEHLPGLRANYSQMIQLMQNLLSNAVKFSRSGVPPVIIIEGRESGREVVFSIKDNGIGIDIKHAEKVFAIFQRLHAADEYEGTGIGLAICKRIVERHKGKIWFESVPGEGATFFVSFPKNLKRI